MRMSCNKCNKYYDYGTQHTCSFSIPESELRGVYGQVIDDMYRGGFSQSQQSQYARQRHSFDRQAFEQAQRDLQDYMNASYANNFYNPDVKPSGKSLFEAAVYYAKQHNCSVYMMVYKERDEYKYIITGSSTVWHKLQDVVVGFEVSQAGKILRSIGLLPAEFQPSVANFQQEQSNGTVNG